MQFPNESGTAKLRQNEAIHRIFRSERNTVSQFVKFRPMVEAYLQSLDPEQVPEPTIDDAYFLRQVGSIPKAISACSSSIESTLTRTTTN